MHFEFRPVVLFDNCCSGKHNWNVLPFVVFRSNCELVFLSEAVKVWQTRTTQQALPKCLLLQLIASSRKGILRSVSEEARCLRYVSCPLASFSVFPSQLNALEIWWTKKRKKKQKYIYFFTFLWNNNNNNKKKQLTGVFRITLFTKNKQIKGLSGFQKENNDFKRLGLFILTGNIKRLMLL